MGTELMLATAELNVAQGIAEQRATELTDDELGTVFEHAEGFELHDHHTTEVLRNKLLNALNTAYSAERDEIVRLHVRGGVIAIAGGTSWSDTYTEAYDDISLVGASGVTLQKGYRWASTAKMLVKHFRLKAERLLRRCRQSFAETRKS